MGSDALPIVREQIVNVIAALHGSNPEQIQLSLGRYMGLSISSTCRSIHDRLMTVTRTIPFTANGGPTYGKWRPNSRDLRKGAAWSRVLKDRGTPAPLPGQEGQYEALRRGEPVYW